VEWGKPRCSFVSVAPVTGNWRVRNRLLGSGVHLVRLNNGVLSRTGKLSMFIKPVACWPYQGSVDRLAGPGLIKTGQQNNLMGVLHSQAWLMYTFGPGNRLVYSIRGGHYLHRCVDDASTTSHGL